MHPQKVNGAIAFLNILIIAAGALVNLLFEMLDIWLIGMAAKHMKFKKLLLRILLVAMVTFIILHIKMGFQMIMHAGLIGICIRTMRANECAVLILRVLEPLRHGV